MPDCLIPEETVSVRPVSVKTVSVKTLSAKMVSVKNVTLCYGPASNRFRALDDVSLDFAPGSLTVVSGPSGSGKTSLLSVMACLVSPDAGSVAIDGQDTGKLNQSGRARLRAEKIGFVFQAFRLFKSLSALENVELGARIAGEPPNRSLARARLIEFGLGHRLDECPDALSGGEKQRVAIARALIHDPPIILADEPTASLDSHAGERICELLRRVAEELGRTVVVVTHDQRWAGFANRIVTLSDGRVVEDKTL